MDPGCEDDIPHGFFDYDYVRGISDDMKIM